MSDKQNTETEKILCRSYYINGAHAGNIYYRVEGWGINSPEIEAEVKRLIDIFITQLSID